MPVEQTIDSNGSRLNPLLSANTTSSYEILDLIHLNPDLIQEDLHNVELTNGRLKSSKLPSGNLQNRFPISPRSGTFGEDSKSDATGFHLASQSPNTLAKNKASKMITDLLPKHTSSSPKKNGKALNPKQQKN